MEDTKIEKKRNDKDKRQALKKKRGNWECGTGKGEEGEVDRGDKK